MKSVLKKILLVLLVALLSFANSTTVQSNIVSLESKADITGTVYVCGGQYAKRYHSRNNCNGLNNCKGGIYTMSSQQAAYDEGFTPCKICWY